MPIENPHAAGYDMVYVPDAKLGIVSDLYFPGAPVPSNAVVAGTREGVEKWGIKPERLRWWTRLDRGLSDVISGSKGPGWSAVKSAGCGSAEVARHVVPLLGHHQWVVTRIEFATDLFRIRVESGYRQYVNSNSRLTKSR